MGKLSRYNVCKKSKLMDPKWYKKTYRLHFWQNPVKHYINVGWKLGYNPSKYFIGDWYLEANPDVEKSGVNPLYHFERFGRNEIRQLITDLRIIKNSKLFDIDYYSTLVKEASKTMNTYVNQFDNLYEHYLNIGWKLNLTPAEKFDANRYMNDHIDVKNCPLIHYERIGVLNKNVYTIFAVTSIDKIRFIKSDFTQKKNKFLLISRLPLNDGVTIWRINFLKEYILKHTDFDVCIEIQNDISPDFYDNVIESKVIIFSRPANDYFFNSILRYCINYNVKLYADLDDLLLPSYGVFERGGFKSKVSNIEHQVDWDKFKKNEVMSSLPITLVDGLICSTKKISEIYSKLLNVKTHVHPNLISYKFLEESLNLFKNINTENYIFKKQSDFDFHLLIASGSFSHLYDVSTIFMGLVSFLSRNPNVQLTLLGSGLSDSNLMKKLLPNQLKIIPKVSFNEMLYIYSLNDLLIVPLDCNEFNECKSNIKFIESAVVGVPCLVKNIYEFSKNIIHKQNGLLYSNEDDFVKQLEWSYNNRDKLKIIGNNARDYVNKNLSTEYLNPTDIEFFKQLIEE